MRKLQLDGYSTNLFERQAENDRLVARGIIPESGKVTASKKARKELANVDCPMCFGTGTEGWPNQHVKCDVCGGTGRN